MKQIRSQRRMTVTRSVGALIGTVLILAFTLVATECGTSQETDTSMTAGWPIRLRWVSS